MVMTVKTITIDDDLYIYIVSHTQELGEAASPILRRLLRMPSTNGHEAIPPAQPSVPGRGRALLEYLASPDFRVKRNTTQRFLAILGFLYQQDPSGFERVQEISGRSRRYFGRTRKELDGSGDHLHPREIPGSPFVAMT